jgi:hypothetical protein
MFTPAAPVLSDVRGRGSHNNKTYSDGIKDDKKPTTLNTNNNYTGLSVSSPIQQNKSNEDPDLLG